VKTRILLGALLVLTACSPSSPSTSLCPDASTSTLTVSVVNDTNQAVNICDATVVATGPTTVTLMPGGGASSSSCDYIGTVSGGAYTITATASASCMASGGCFPVTSIHTVVQAGCDTPAAVDVTPTM
jgi:hypothetical protein